MARTVYDRWEIEVPHNQFRGYVKTPFFCDCDCGERAKKEINSNLMKCPKCSTAYQMIRGEFVKLEK